MGPLLGYLRQVGFAPVPPVVVAETPMQTLRTAYRFYLIQEHGLAASTVRNYLSVAQQFASNRDASDPANLGGVTAAEVSEFVLASCRFRSVGSATVLVVGLRALLRYLHLAGITPAGLAGAVAWAACWPATTLPRPISPGDAKRLLRSCDRRTAGGRRDFAVLTLLLRLGLRVSEVAALELGDVDWRDGEILIRGKGRREAKALCRRRSGSCQPARSALHIRHRASPRRRGRSPRRRMAWARRGRHAQDVQPRPR